jgi:hypothetical protein
VPNSAIRVPGGDARVPNISSEACTSCRIASLHRTTGRITYLWRHTQSFVSSSGHENPERFRAAARGRQYEIGQEYVHTHNHTLLVLALEQLLCVYSGIRKLRAFTELEESLVKTGL